MEAQKNGYSVISKWVEPDGTEQWDVVHNGHVSYDEALEISKLASKTWDRSEKGRGIPHREIPIKFEKLQKMIEEENDI